jgi:uncharacterized phage protein gp47/JayE
MYTPRTSTEIVRDLVARFVARTDLTDIAETSVTGVLLRTVAEQIADSDVRLSQIREQFTLNGASGVDLDERVEELGLSRLSASAASGVITVTRTDTTAALVVPLGSVFGRSGSDVTYQTTSANTLAIGEASKDVTVVASVAGSSGNCAPRSIDTIIEAPNAVVSITQGLALANGRDAETDSDLRARATRHLNSLARSQPVALTHAALSYSASDGTRATTATLYEPINELGRCELLIDDGSGLGANPAKRLGSAVSVTLNAVRGQLIGVESPVVDAISVKNGTTPLIEDRDYTINRARGIITLEDSAAASGDTINVDGYEVYTGLVAELQSLIDGDLGDIKSGYRAAGISARVLPAPVQLVSLDIHIVAASGSTLTTVKREVEAEVAAYLSALDAGAPAYRAAMVSRVMQVSGVVNARVLTAGTATETPDIYPTSSRTVLRAGTLRAVTSITGV